jgi:hypothetical protein
VQEAYKLKIYFSKGRRTNISNNGIMGAVSITNIAE